MLEALNARDDICSSVSVNLVVYEEYSLLVNEEMSINNLDKLIRKSNIYVKIITVIKAMVDLVY